MRYVLLLLVTGCFSDQEARQQWDTWVDAHNSCSVAADCVEIYPGCPLGCGTPIRAEYQDEALVESQQIRNQYKLGGKVCYEPPCEPPPPLVCENQICDYQAE